MDDLKELAMKPQVLITGFSVFPSAPVNPTESLIEWLAAQNLLRFDADFHFHLFKTSYAQVDRDLAELSIQLNPDIVLHFGLDQNATGFKLEAKGRNALHMDKPDVDGYCPEACISVDGAREISSTFPTHLIGEALEKKGFTVQRSNDAGGYLCNYLLYRTLSADCWQIPPRYAGFIHVPHLEADHETLAKHCDISAMNYMREDDLHAGIITIIAVCLTP